MTGRGPSLAVVGSGPAAFYTVLRAAQKCPNLRVDMFERQCVPYGLTRFGVAPDHPEVKNCQERFAEVPNMCDFRFHGNCEVGSRVKLPELARNFDAVLLAYGANSERTLDVAGEDLPGVFSARHFVGWYNGEPEFQDLNIGGFLERAERATIVGNGNVALDVARILLRTARDLEHTDITKQATEALKKSRVKHVKIVGRRGALHSAFTNKELRELQREPGTTMLPVDPISELDIATVSRQDKRKLDLLRKAEAQAEHEFAEHEEQPRTWQLGFLRSPGKFVGDSHGLTGIEWVHNEYNSDGKSVKPTGQKSYEPTELAFTSIGYKSLELPGLKELGIEFNSSKGVVPRSRGKVLAKAADNIFASGWAATGPVGVIASTMMDAFSVGDEIVNYLTTKESTKPGRDAINIKGDISWQDWLKIDAEEIRRGGKEGKPRTKFQNSAEIINWLNSQ